MVPDPDVSVLTPSYGYGRFIGDALESVKRQDGVSVEHIVQDAGSEDETIDILRGYGERLRWRSEPDRGQSDALNKALQLARGRWVAWLNADEFYFPGALQALVAIGDKTKADVVYGDSAYVDVDGRLLRLGPQHGYSRFLLRNYGVYIPSCGVLFRRSALGEDPWDVEIRRVMDWEIYLKLDSRGARFVHVAYPAAGFRMHEGQITAQPRELFESDRQAVRSRYGIRGRRLKKPARWLHASHKLVSGAYRKQIIARRMQGTDLRWMTPGVGPEGTLDLIRRCYGVEPQGGECPDSPLAL
jgi:glycosyltransferase involved in cell wall biosynthesis